MIWSNYWAKNTQETKSIQVEGRKGERQTHTNKTRADEDDNDEDDDDDDNK